MEVCQQAGVTPKPEKIPPGVEDFPETVQMALEVFNNLGDRIGEGGYQGKDYTTLPIWLSIYEIEDKEFFLKLLNWIDSRAIKKSAEDFKREMQKAKRQSSGKK